MPALGSDTPKDFADVLAKQFGILRLPKGAEKKRFVMAARYKAKLKRIQAKVRELRGGK